MVNKYLECLAVEGNYSKARIGLLLLGIFSLSVFIWLIVLTVQVGNAGKESSGGACADLSGTWSCSHTDPKIPGSHLFTYVQKKCTGETAESLYTVCGHTVTVIGGLTMNNTNTGEVNELITEIKFENYVCRKVPGPVPNHSTEKPATTTGKPEPVTTTATTPSTITTTTTPVTTTATTPSTITTTTTPAKPPAPKVNWIGPTKRVWINAQCPLAGFGGTKNLDECKKDCIEKTGCTAIVYKKGTNCYLRACTQPVPEPTFKKPGYKGYYLTKGSLPTQPTEKPATTTETPECKTKPTQDADNPVPESDCIFPFKYGQFSHDSCTKAGEFLLPASHFWCATSVDNKTRKMVAGKWGQCNDKCPKEDD